MKLTPYMRKLRRIPHKHLDDWYCIDDRTCSFHLNRAGGEGFVISTSLLLRKLQAAGLLAQWDQKQQIMRKR